MNNQKKKCQTYIQEFQKEYEKQKNGIKVGISKGVKLTTKKSTDCKKIILKHSKDFGGSLTDIDVIKLCGCSRQSYYKYKAEIKRTDSI